MENTSLQQQLLEAGVHFGHLKKKWNPKMLPYIFAEKKGIHIIDLNKTVEGLQESAAALKAIARSGKKIMFVATKKQAKEIVSDCAKRVNMPYVTERWLGGMLTNWTTLKERIKHLKDLEQQEANDTFSLLTKKEAALRRKELKRLRQHLDGIKTMPDLPDIAIIIDQKREMTAIRECQKLGIPIVSILDTNCDPDLVDIPIPGNDDAVRSIKLILKSLTDSIIKGKSELN